jgi:ribonucleoside-diphosphate reductase alpha chain
MAKLAKNGPEYHVVAEATTGPRIEEREIRDSKETNGKKYPGIKVTRYYTKSSEHPYDSIEWELRDALILGKDGNPVFEQRGVEFPKGWSETASNIVASKYFYGKMGQKNREWSLKQIVDRVADTITRHGIVTGFFADKESAEIFNHELKSDLVNQRVSFNSPVWFNIGVPGISQQASACFILHVDDSMESILNWFVEEGTIFKRGSGAGINLSTLRSSEEKLRGGGVSSGPVSFMRGADAVAGSIKSGGTTRRAAKMVVLNVDHPDVEEFIASKLRANMLAWEMAKAGHNMSDLEDWTYDHIQFQNANNSVRVTDEFMKAVEEDGDWKLKTVTTGDVAKTIKAREIWSQIVKAAWDCADPGLQFDTIVNKWHTCPNSGRINASNPCSEYMHVDNSACNLASMNLMRFAKEDRGFDVAGYRHVSRITTMAQELLVGYADYPTEKIGANARAMRQLGQGYANLGSLLMFHGYAYDSDEGRDYAAALTAIMTGEVYRTSAEIARDSTGPYDVYEVNKSGHNKVMKMHRDAAYRINSTNIPDELGDGARQVWDEVIDLGVKQGSGFRNAQATVLAPTGTIGFMMDCDTTSAEPDFALVRMKRMVGGGFFTLVNGTVPTALKNLGYTEEEVSDMVNYLQENGNLETHPTLREDHKSVFDCAVKLKGGTRYIAPIAHVRMMSAVQPFISGAISKTANLPADATEKDVADIYMQSWKLGIKAIALYRDGCKPNQPMSTDNKSLDRNGDNKPRRERLPDTRKSVTHKFRVGTHEVYATVGFYEDGRPGELFLNMAKEGSTLSGMADSYATAVSIMLQYGVPLKDIVRKYMYTRFEPSGWTGDSRVGLATSIVDAVVRWMGHQFLNNDEKLEIGLVATGGKETVTPITMINTEVVMTKESLANGLSNGVGESVQSMTPKSMDNSSDAPACDTCGFLMIRNGTCYKCPNCGSTTGCS